MFSFLSYLHYFFLVGIVFQLLFAILFLLFANLTQFGISFKSRSILTQVGLTNVFGFKFYPPNLNPEPDCDCGKKFEPANVLVQNEAFLSHFRTYGLHFPGNKPLRFTFVLVI